MTAVVDPIDAWLWGDGFYEQGRAYYPPLPLEPVQHRVKCAKCGKGIPPDEHVAFDGLAFHSYCLPTKFQHPEERP